MCNDLCERIQRFWEFCRLMQSHHQWKKKVFWKIYWSEKNTDKKKTFKQTKVD